MSPEQKNHTHQWYLTLNEEWNEIERESEREIRQMKWKYQPQQMHNNISGSQNSIRQSE